MSLQPTPSHVTLPPFGEEPKPNGDTKDDAKRDRRLALWRKRERAFTRLANANEAFNRAEEALAAYDRKNP